MLAIRPESTGGGDYTPIQEDCLFRFGWRAERINERYYRSDDLLKIQGIGIQVQVCMLSGVAQSAQLFSIFLVRPIQFSPSDGVFIRNIQVDQDIRVCHPFPHIRDVRMLLSDVPDQITMGF